ncbi:MAG: formylmethanofuran--tetrahydromethanopterin formyltransferase [Archaeoglobi archaeon]|jgi:formylmethanofuran--tetrahydromethanopterin N-formyltransferase|nr:formylmethanofuran--tetrahydromethanopterin N-formyltransferase [Archaeoglobus sp.]NHW88433.1 formylmethanofuran--tetrahydromethanopterin N-formyltransferase [Archaeoglobales archaeon]TDA27287.1 MAG: formylmethanofuran--tetrahydromethanopterin formyltransferase [Archaeoglobi archaeon]TDA28026.1 MAG: formylmethanofuran--tetrahydromethanopterin formyltransferase [Archaeoglobi archaeon]
MLEINGVPVEDTYCEAFDGIYSRFIVTAKHKWLLEKAAVSATALPSTVFGESEGGIEKWLSPSETPDGRVGAICQVWVQKSKKFMDVLMREMSKRIRQGILVVPTTRVFNATESETKFDAEINVGRCGDGYEWEEERWGRKVIVVPIMFGEFVIERYIGYANGIAGGNIWIFCESEDSALEAGEACVEALKNLDGVITSFDICSAGSKPETKYPEIGPTTNHYYCPILKGKIPDSKVPDGVRSIPEIVINGTNLEAVEKAMFICLKTASRIDGVVKLSAGNYGGKLGQHKIYLRDIIKKYEK